MKSKKTIKSIVLTSIIAIASLFFITISFAANEGSTAKVTVETARLRQQASENSTILELISVGEEVKIVAQEGDWYRVEYNNITGYLRNDLIEVNGNQSSGTGENSSESQQTGNTASTENEQPEQNQTTSTGTQPENEQNSTNQTENPETTAGENNQTQEANNNNVANAEGQTENTESEEFDYTSTYSFIENTEIKITPLINSLSTKTANAGENVKITDKVNEWVLINNETTEGWVRLEKLNKVEQNAETTQEQKTSNTETQTTEPTEESIVPQTKTMYVNSQSVNVRSEASQSSEVIMSATLNTEVTVIEEQNGWSRVIVNGTQGYISSSLLSETRQETSRGMTIPRTTGTAQNEQTQQTNNTNSEQSETNTDSSTTSNSNKGAEVLAYAMQYIGYPYVYGGSSTSGFDCSGFTSYVYKHFGITLNRTAAGQYSNGVKVSRSNLQAGDLIMFGSPINHVGIYAGGGRIVHAANPSRGITTDTINSGYYNTHYVGAVRIFN